MFSNFTFNCYTDRLAGGEVLKQRLDAFYPTIMLTGSHEDHDRNKESVSLCRESEPIDAKRERQCIKRLIILKLCGAQFSGFDIKARRNCVSPKKV